VNTRDLIGLDYLYVRLWFEVSVSVCLRTSPWTTESPWAIITRGDGCCLLPAFSSAGSAPAQSLPSPFTA